MPGLLAGRLRHVWRAWLPAVAALALAVAMPVVAAGVASLTAASALREALAALPPGQRTVAVAASDRMEGADYRRLDALVVAQLPRIAAGPIRRQLLYRPVSDGVGGDFVLAGTDQLAGAVRLTTGRLPDRCSARRCEVLVFGDAQVKPPAELGLIVVGRAERADPLLLTGTFDPGPGVTVLLGEGVSEVASLPALTSFGRSTGWAAALDADQVRAVGAQAWVAESVRVAQDLWRDGDGLGLTTADEVVLSQDRRARLSAERFDLLFSSMAVLVLGAAVVGGAGMRTDHDAFVTALRTRGARPSQTAGASAAEVAAVALVGVLLGLLLGAAAAAVLAGSAAEAPGVVAVAAGQAGPVVAVLGLLAAALLAVTVRGRTGWSLVGGTALSCALGAGLLLVRGGTGTDGGRDPILALLPALVLTAAALTVARFWPAMTRLSLRLVPRSALAARLGVAVAAGRPLRPAATAALLTAAIAAATFAGAYRATLERGAADQAAFAVPMDARLSMTGAGRRPQDMVDPARLLAAAGGDPGGVVPVLRAAASVPVTAGRSESVQMIGLAPEALARLVRWNAVTGAAPGEEPSVLARRIAVRPGRPGTALPPGRALRIATATPVPLAVTAHLRTADGRERGVALRVGRQEGQAGFTGRLSTELPQLPSATGSSAPLWLMAITVRQATDDADRRQHNLGESGRDRAAPTGRIVLGEVEVDSKDVPRPWAGWSPTGPPPSPGADPSADPGADGGALSVDYQLTSGVLALYGRTGWAGEAGRPLPVITDRRTAAQATSGRVSFTVDGEPVPVEVVAALDSFPTVAGPTTSGRFAIADREALAALVDARTPGSGQATEIWLDVPGGSDDLAAVAALTTRAGLELARRGDREAALRADPVARAASGLLLGGAAVVALVAVLALLLLVRGERREDAAVCYAWEADGVAPSTLRAALWWRVVPVSIPAVVLGVVVGSVLSLLAARMVAVTAVATTPQPALVAVTGPGHTAGLIVAVLAVVLAVSAVIAATTMREPAPVRAVEAG